MTQSADELIVGAKGSVYEGPAGTDLPANTSPRAALDAAYNELGYISEEGVSFSVGKEIIDFMAWQRKQPVRREVDSQEIQMNFALLQWNPDTVPFAFGGSEVVETASGVFAFDFPSEDDPLAEHAIVIDWEDGEDEYRLAFHRGNVTEAVETTLVRSALAQLPIGFKVLGPDEGGSPGFAVFGDESFSLVS